MALSICLLLFIFVITTQSAGELIFLDNPWYLNRARLIWQGVLPDMFVYTLAYPAVVGLIDPLVGDVILAGMLANAVTMLLIVTGVYILGRWLYRSERVAWFAVVFTATNASLWYTMRLLSAYLPFTAAVIWCVIAALLYVRRPSIWTAACLGLVLALAVYTRLEGAVYTVLVPITVGIVYRQHREARRAIVQFATATIVFVVLALPFALNMLQTRQMMDTTLSADVNGIFTLMKHTPIEWDVIWRRVTDTITGTLSHWSSVAWIVGAAGVLWASKRYRVAQWLFAGLIGFNFLYTFALAIWPYPIHIVFYVPFLALILAGTLDQWIRRGRGWRLAALVVAALIILPSVMPFVTMATHTAPLAYRVSAEAQSGAALDNWIEAQGWGERRIYTFCSRITSYSRARFQIMYRLLIVTGWDTPERLIPKMRDEGALLMTCGEVTFPDWRKLFEDGFPAGLVEAGRYDTFVFYRPDDA